MRKIRNIFLKILLVAGAALFVAAAFSCAKVPSDSTSEPVSETDLQPDESIEPPSAPPQHEGFATYEEAEAAIYALRRTRFEAGVYERQGVLAFEDATVEAVQYLRHNKEDDGYLVRCAEFYRAMLTALENVEYNRGDVPRVYINMTGGITREKYARCTVTLVDRAGGGYETVKDKSCLIRLRGNSTSVAEKKPYNIKFSFDTEVFGMESGSKWALLANHFDKTLIRNKLSLDCAAEFGVTASLDSRFAEVYLNGKLLGSYLVCEPVTDGKHRADIDVTKGEFMVERVKNWASPEGESVITSRLGLRFDIKYDQSGAEKIASVLNYAERAIISGDRAEIESRIDVDSFVNMYLIHELLKDCDMTYGSSYLCYKNGRLYCGPLWDMDLSTGNVSVYHDEDKYRVYNNTAPFGDGSGDSASGFWARQEWFAYLCECPFFAEKVKERYASLAPYIESLYAENGYIDSLVAEYGASFGRNYGEAGWSISSHASVYESQTEYASYSQTVEELKAWLRRRHEYLSSALG